MKPSYTFEESHPSTGFTLSLLFYLQGEVLTLRTPLRLLNLKILKFYSRHCVDFIESAVTGRDLEATAVKA